jgi:hypothetical protein
VCHAGELGLSGCVRQRRVPCPEQFVRYSPCEAPAHSVEHALAPELNLPLTVRCTPRRLGEDPPPFAAGGFDALGSGSHRTTGTAALSYTVYFRSVGRRKEGNDLLHTHTTTHTRTHNHTRTHTQTTSDPLEEENQRKWFCCCMLHRCGPSRRARLLSAALSTLCPHSPLASRGSLRVIARTGTVGTVVPCGVLRPRRSQVLLVCPTYCAGRCCCFLSGRCHCAKDALSETSHA